MTPHAWSGDAGKVQLVDAAWQAVPKALDESVPARRLDSSKVVGRRCMVVQRFEPDRGHAARLRPRQP